MTLQMGKSFDMELDRILVLRKDGYCETFFSHMQWERKGLIVVDTKCLFSFSAFMMLAVFKMSQVFFSLTEPAALRVFPSHHGLLSAAASTIYIERDRSGSQVMGT